MGPPAQLVTSYSMWSVFRAVLVEGSQEVPSSGAPELSTSKPRMSSLEGLGCIGAHTGYVTGLAGSGEAETRIPGMCGEETRRPDRRSRAPTYLPCTCLD